MTVLESNADGREQDPGLAILWGARQAAAAAARRLQTPRTTVSATSAMRVVAAAAVDDIATADLRPGTVVDGVTLVTGDVVLLLGQSATESNGVWVIAEDDSTPALPAAGDLFFVLRGEQLAGRMYACVGTGPPPTIRPVHDGASEAAIADIRATYATRALLAEALSKGRPVCAVSPPYAALMSVAVTGEWVGRCTYYCPNGAIPTSSSVTQVLQLDGVFAEGDEVEVVNASAFPLRVVGPPPGCRGPLPEARVYVLGGDVLGLGDSIVPQGAALIKQIRSTSIADTTVGKALSVLVGAIVQ